MFQSSKSEWETSTEDKEIGNLICIIRGPCLTHKRHLNQIRKWYSNSVKNKPREEGPMDVVSKKFEIPIPTNDSRTQKIQKKTRNNGFNWYKPPPKNSDSIRSKAKKEECYGDIPYDFTAWTLPDTINSCWLDKRGKRVKLVTGNRYCLYFRKLYFRKYILL